MLLIKSKQSIIDISNINTHEYGKGIQEKPANCTLIHKIDDVTLFVLKDWQFLFDFQWFLHSSKIRYSNLYY